MNYNEFLEFPRKYLNSTATEFTPFTTAERVCGILATNLDAGSTADITLKWADESQNYGTLLLAAAGNPGASLFFPLKFFAAHGLFVEVGSSSSTDVTVFWVGLSG